LPTLWLPTTPLQTTPWLKTTPLKPTLKKTASSFSSQASKAGPMTESVVRARLRFAYDGTDFAGWAMQPGLRTVEGVMMEGLARLAQDLEPPRLVVAGRTDAGVHARGQVAHVDFSPEAWARMRGHKNPSPAKGLLHRLPGVLPPDITIHDVDEAPAGFSARFSALSRRYAYRVCDQPDRRDPLTRRHVLWHKKPLDDGLLATASASLIGLRDFSPFCRPRPGATTIRQLTTFAWDRPVTGPDEGLLVATLEADAFCHSMVRSLVGAVLAVAEGTRTLDWLADQAAGSERSQIIKVAKAQGLTLESVTYPPDSEVAAQAEANRVRRTLD
jgi:tRNA pseudouridine38-40 synthase